MAFLKAPLLMVTKTQETINGQMEAHMLVPFKVTKWKVMDVSGGKTAKSSRAIG